MASHDGTMYFLDDSDQVWKTSASSFKDGSTAYGVSLETGWMSLAGVSGFQRLYSLYIDLSYKSEHTLRVSIAYDYGSYTDTVDFDPDDATDDDVYRLEVYSSIQKCTAFRVKIEEIITDGTAGTHESFQIHFATAKVGIKSGTAKLKPAQRVGAS